jgi:hypothetical protein
MKILYVHLQEQFLAGAEKMLQYFASAMLDEDAGHAIITSGGAETAPGPGV